MNAAAQDSLQWFHRKVGRPAHSIQEATARILAEIDEINPRLRRRGELLREFATAEGGRTLDYAKLWEPYTWGDWHLKRSNQAVSELLGISEDEGYAILDSILQNVLVRLKQTPEYRSQPDPNQFLGIDLKS